MVAEMGEIIARLEALEEALLGNLDPIAREKYQMRLQAALRRRGAIRSERSGPE